MAEESSILTMGAPRSNTFLNAYAHKKVWKRMFGVFWEDLMGSMAAPMKYVHGSAIHVMK